MSTQIQTTAGDIVKAYDRNIPEVLRLHEMGVLEYEAAKAAWKAKSAWYRFWHSYSEPCRWQYFDAGYVRRLNEERSFYAGLDSTTVVLLDENQAVYLGINDVPTTDL